MDNYNVISKGAYSRPQTKNFVGITSFIFIRQNEKKYLLLQLKNPRAEVAEEINLQVTLLDRKGRTINGLYLSSDKAGAANSSFAFGERIEVPEECCDFTAKVESAVFGGCLYRNGKSGVVADYTAEREERFDVSTVKAAMRGKTRVVADRRLGVPVLVAVLTCLLLVCAALVTYFQLKDFMLNATGFTYSGVEYIFEDGDKTAGSNIIVTGYRGKKPNVVIPEKIDGYVVSEIREGAFRGNGKIKRLKIEGNVKIGKDAFAECGALASVEVTGEGEIAMGTGAFNYCPKLESVKIAKKINYSEDIAVFIGDSAIKELYLNNYDGGRISRLFGAEVLSKCALKNLTVSYLGVVCDNFCYNLGNLESVEIAYIDGENFEIGDYAFYRTSLKTLTLPDGLTAVGEYAFSGTELSSFNAAGVESIGTYAFMDCDGLTGFTVPESLTVLNRGAFSGCENLEKIVFESEEKLEYIGDYAFSYCESLKEIKIPDSVEYMGRELFYGCAGMVSLTLPYIGSGVDGSDTSGYLFGGSNNLKSLTLTKAKTLAAQALYGCEKLKEVNLNDGLETIGNYAFAGCTGLKSIVIPASVSFTGFGIFENCYRLFEVYNLSAAEIECDYAIAVYSSLEQSVEKHERDGYTVALSDGRYAQPAGWYLIDYPEEQDLNLPQIFWRVDNYKVIDYLFYREEITSVSLPDTVTDIGKYAFYRCDMLTQVMMNVSVSEIKEYAFYGCVSLSYISLPRSVTKVGANAFNGCSALENIEISGNVTEIGESAFSYCASLKEMRIYNSDPVALGDDAFYGCTSLCEVRIDGEVSAIGYGAFGMDNSLEQVEIGYLTGAIEGYAFHGCTSLCEMTIPTGTKAIGECAFLNCKALNKITLPGTLEEIGDNAFDGCTRLFAVVNYSGLNIVRDESFGGVGKLAEFIVTGFTAAQNLAYTEIDGVTFLHLYNDWVAVWCNEGITSLNLNAGNVTSLRVAANAFAGNSQITSADLSGVSSIGDEAFKDCTSLENVILNGELTSIGENAFMCCFRLSAINLQDTNLTYMGESAFYDCLALTYVSLPDTLRQIPARAFYYCSALSDAVIPSSVAAIEEEAFYGCTSLLQVHNLSYLTMRAGSTGNGYCAYYALHIFTDAQNKMTFAETRGYKFANYNQNWYLYACSNYETYKKLPESFTFENSTITSYIIRDGAFNARPYLIIPTAVSAIESDAIISSHAIYYCGTPTQWATIRPASLGNAAVYYYSKCIHADDDGLWTYNASGNPSTMQTSLVWTETKSPTCTADGERTGKCQECGRTFSEAVGKLYHSCGADGKCLVCGVQGEYANGESGNYGSYTIAVGAFNYDGEKFVSANIALGTFAEITLTANADMQVCFGCYTTSNYYDVLSVTAAGELIADISSSYLREIKVELKKGQTLTFSYYKGGYSYGCATITYILILA